ncbi:MAG: hypothetical protein ACJ757_08555 [Gaiellaceae bacterium]
MATFRSQLLLPFDTDSADFVRGFEIGALWTLLAERPEKEVEEYVHTENTEMVMRLGEATGRQTSGEELGNGWLLVRFSAASTY